MSVCPSVRLTIFRSVHPVPRNTLVLVPIKPRISFDACASSHQHIHSLRSSRQRKRRYQTTDQPIGLQGPTAVESFLMSIASIPGEFKGQFQLHNSSKMRLIAINLLSLITFGLQLAGSGAQRCVTGDAPSNRDADQRLTLNGRILSYESGCHAPLDSAAVRLYLGCPNSESYDGEPFAGWKTDEDGMFEVSLPFNHDKEGPVRVKICLEQTRSCLPVTVEISGLNPASAVEPKPVAARTTSQPVSGLASKPVTVLESKPVSVQSLGGDSFWSTASVSLCLGGGRGGKGQRRRLRRATGWDDLDMNWLKRGLRQEANVKQDGKRGWSNGIPWLKRVQGKRLWEGADEEVGWIKRKDQQNPRQGKIDETGSFDAGDDSHSGLNPSKLSRGPQNPRVDEHQLPVMRQRSLSKTMAWPQPEMRKKYWAESDMSWL